MAKLREGSTVDGKLIETVEGAQLKADTAEQKAIDWVRSFGLGGSAAIITGQDLNIVRDTGFYIGENLLNAPEDNPGWFYTIYIRTGGSCFQMALRSNGRDIYTRHHGSSAGWSSWDRQETTEGAQSKVDNAVSSLQPQIDSKLPLSGGNMAGTLNLNSNTRGRIVLPVGSDKWAT